MVINYPLLFSAFLESLVNAQIVSNSSPKNSEQIEPQKSGPPLVVHTHIFPAHMWAEVPSLSKSIPRIAQSSTKKKRLLSMRNTPTFFPSASTTALVDGRNFTGEWADVRGHIVADVLRVGDANNTTPLTATSVRVGVIDHASIWSSCIRVDALIGLSNYPNSSVCDECGCNCVSARSNLSFIEQVVDTWPKPIITLYSNRCGQLAVWVGRCLRAVAGWGVESACRRSGGAHQQAWQSRDRNCRV